MKWSRSIFSIVLITVAVQSLLAVWVGKGEISGQVTRSKNISDRTVFELTISSQKIDGQNLGSPNTFSYSGAGRMDITPGDTVKLVVNSSDNYGIRVNKLEFIENKSGTIKESVDIRQTTPVLVPGQNGFMLTVLISLGSLVFIAAAFLLFRRYSKQRR